MGFSGYLGNGQTLKQFSSCLLGVELGRHFNIGKFLKILPFYLRLCHLFLARLPRGPNHNICFLKMGQSRPLFVYFSYFLNTISIIQIEKSVDGVLGIRTRGRRMVGADKTTELWRPPSPHMFVLIHRGATHYVQAHCGMELASIHLLLGLAPS